MLLVPWKRHIFAPPFLFQISNDVQPRCYGGLVTPKFAHLLNACKVMAQFAVAHPVRRLARKLIQPAMHVFKRLAQRGGCFRAVLCERRHKLFRVPSRSGPKADSRAVNFIWVISGKHFSEGVITSRWQFSAETLSESCGLGVVEPAKDTVADQATGAQ